MTRSAASSTGALASSFLGERRGAVLQRGPGLHPGRAEVLGDDGQRPGDEQGPEDRDAHGEGWGEQPAGRELGPGGDELGGDPGEAEGERGIGAAVHGAQERRDQRRAAEEPADAFPG